MARCSSCGAEIRWIRTISGKTMPCNTEKVYYKYELGAADRVVTPNGEVLPAVILDGPDGADGVAFTSHFATCPKADKHRRR